MFTRVRDWFHLRSVFSPRQGRGKTTLIPFHGAVLYDTKEEDRDVSPALDIETSSSAAIVA